MIVNSRFRPAWWLPGPHLQTLWPTLFRRRPRISFYRERLELPDGDFVDLDWTEDSDGPLALVFHGLEGSSRSHYAGGMVHSLQSSGFQAVVMHFRGCSGVPNRLPRSYHAGDTTDMRFVVERIKARFPEKPLLGVGYSLGGNALLKWLGESGEDNPLSCAVAVSVPFDLAVAADRLERDISQIYQRYILKNLKRSLRRKLSMDGLPVNESQLRKLKTLRQFDDAVTAPLHGFTDVHEYYSYASCHQYLRGITRATLILHARDDPFMFADAIPDRHALADTVTLELSDQGGHVGFVSGWSPGRAHYWLEARITQWLNRPYSGRG